MMKSDKGNITQRGGERMLLSDDQSLGGKQKTSILHQESIFLQSSGFSCKNFLAHKISQALGPRGKKVIG